MEQKTIPAFITEVDSIVAVQQRTLLALRQANRKLRLCAQQSTLVQRDIEAGLSARAAKSKVIKADFTEIWTRLRALKKRLKSEYPAAATRALEAPPVLLQTETTTPELKIHTTIATAAAAAAADIATEAEQEEGEEEDGATPIVRLYHPQNAAVSQARPAATLKSFNTAFLNSSSSSGSSSSSDEE
jgi:hypothetical protein